uniref:Uncharacterized protein n=1 Tax=Ditylenchus dipsaci TaxID=166011 RepID=A0A915CYL0_9BILA
MLPSSKDGGEKENLNGTCNCRMLPSLAIEKLRLRKFLVHMLPSSRNDVVRRTKLNGDEAWDGTCARSFTHGMIIFGWDKLINPESGRVEPCWWLRCNYEKWGRAAYICASMKKEENKCGILTQAYYLNLWK